ncbi:MAG: hypothetical protein U1F36_05955 [Planctomycetota bacterium]
MRSVAASLVFLVLAACASNQAGEGANLAEQPPLPYSVLVAGGGVVEATVETGVTGGPYARTFAALDDTVAVTADDLTRALRETRVFTRVAPDPSGDARIGFAMRDLREGLPLDRPEIVALLSRARAEGHDYVLLLQRLVDGPIEEWGINDRWPLTLATWLLVGLGVVVQDHTFESRASLEAALFDVEDGRLIHRSIGGGAVVELALIGRGGFWSIAQSIVVPPFWVASQEDDVVASVRETTMPRLVTSLARDLKGVACRRDIAEHAPAEIDVQQIGDRIHVRVHGREAVGSVAVRTDGAVLDQSELDAFARALLDGQRDGGASAAVLAEADFRAPSAGRLLQVLVRTVTGSVVSTTVELERR